ncbi:hypothetical protein [Lysobacter gummosus]|uniref:hypothetical protein n=1 Tax=Lysobacter gummosus TaxID=262324 RepID=UPI00363E867F
MSRFDASLCAPRHGWNRCGVCSQTRFCWLKPNGSIEKVLSRRSIRRRTRWPRGVRAMLGSRRRRGGARLNASAPRPLCGFRAGRR